MRPVANFTLHAILAACLAALAASSAAAAVKPAIDNEGHAFLTMELMGSAATGSKDQRNQHIDLISYSFGASSVAKVDGFAVKQGVKPYKLDRVFVKSWSTSGDADRPPRGGSNEMIMDDSAGKERSSSGFSGRGLDIARVDGQISPSARAGKIYDSGSVSLSGRFPSCRVGATYPRAAVVQGAELYEMQDVIVANCAGDSMSLNFKKVTVRGWDPAKKEE